MTNEEIQRTMEFILGQQAQFAANTQQLQEERMLDKRRLVRVEESFQLLVQLAETSDSRLDNLESKSATFESNIAALESINVSIGTNMVALEFQMAELTASQAQTDGAVRALAASKVQTDVVLRTLAESQAQTDERLRALIDIVGRGQNGTSN